MERTTAPGTSKSLHAARESLRLDRIDVVHAGDTTFPMAEGFRAVALSRVLDDVEPL